ncbi:hypothetical protein [Deinococcus ficus]|uniref:Uncharacterized protein n=1 Tax=Deinococcus ficus TaxID=317577 RepID=A0A221T3E3_9DEIO|nr:hypothetical protein [Deinococcus ficus]ASN83424.1 hypothetical protein DFI_19700 [Deinococcus ficus]
MTTDRLLPAPDLPPPERTSALTGQANALDGDWAYFTPEARTHATRTHLVRVTSSTQTVKTLCGRVIFRPGGLTFRTDPDGPTRQSCRNAASVA